MNAAFDSYEDQELEYKVEFRTTSGPARAGDSRRPTYGRTRGKRPLSLNGMHRRRNKRIMR